LADFFTGLLLWRARN